MGVGSVIKLRIVMVGAIVLATLIAISGVASATEYLPSTCSDSGDIGPNPCTHAYDHNDNTGWVGGSFPGGPFWIQYDYGAGTPQTIDNITTWNMATYTGTITHFTFRGSNDTTNWDDLIDNTTNPLTDPPSIYQFTNSIAYRYYCLTFLSGGAPAAYVGLGELNLFKDVVPVAPVASFTADHSGYVGVEPQAISFTDTSTNTPTAWGYNMTELNGTRIQFSTSASPSQDFYSGNWSISLIASNGGGSDISTQVTWVNVTPYTSPPAPTVDFTATNTTGDTPLVVHFTDLSTPANTTSWYWEYGDGGTDTSQNPNHIFTTPGVYFVNETACNDFGCDYHLKPSYITANAPPPPGGSDTFVITIGAIPAGYIIDYGAGVTAEVQTYSFESSVDLAAVQSWDISGSNDDITFTPLDSQSGIAFSAGVPHTFTIASPASYRYYEIDLNAGFGVPGASLTVVLNYPGPIPTVTPTVVPSTPFIPIPTPHYPIPGDLSGFIPGDISGKYIPGNITPGWPSCPTLITVAATGITSSTVKLNGDTSAPGTYWFIYGVQPGTYPFRTPNQSATGLFNATIGRDGMLMFNKSYYVRAASDTCFGNELNFTVGPVPVMTITTYGAAAYNLIENGTNDTDPMAMAENVGTGVMAPYAMVFGIDLVISIIVGMVFLGIAFKNDSTAPAIILGMLVGIVAFGYLMPEFIYAAEGCFIMGLAGLAYVVFTKR